MILLESSRYGVIFQPGTTYGHRGQSKQFELVTCRVIASVARGSEHAGTWVADQSSTVREERVGYFGMELGALAMPVIERAALSGQPRSGPLVVQEYDTSVILPPGCRATLDARGNIIVEIALA